MRGNLREKFSPWGRFDREGHRNRNSMPAKLSSNKNICGYLPKKLVVKPLQFLGRVSPIRNPPQTNMDEQALCTG